MKRSTLIPSRKALAGLACSAMLITTPALAQFIPTGAGPYDYNDTANWTGGTINNQFNANPAANQSVFLSVDTVLSSGLTINNTTSFDRLFIGSGNRLLTLGGNVSLGNSTTNLNQVIIGSTTSGQQLNIDLGGATRIFSAGTNRTLELVNTISGTGGFTKSGAGTVRLSGTANTYSGTTQVGGAASAAGVLEVVSVANSGVASSIGMGNSITFGGATASTLRFVGSASSSNRTFTMGGASGNFDASGTGAVAFTATGNINYSSSNVDRVITFTGSSAHNNSISTNFTNSGTGITSISKTGNGKWIFNGANTYTGATSVSAGTLLINGSTSAGSAVSVSAGATLGGTGTVGGTVTVSGTLAPGASIESLRTGTVSFQNGSTFALELDSSALAGAQADLLAVGGDLSLTGTVNLTLTNIALTPAAFTLGTTFSLAGYTGTWNGGLFTIGGNAIADGGTFTVGLNTWQLDYDALTGGTNFVPDQLPSSKFVNMVAVPEPNALLLLAGGLTILVLKRSRRSDYRLA